MIIWVSIEQPCLNLLIILQIIYLEHFLTSPMHYSDSLGTCWNNIICPICLFCNEGGGWYLLINLCNILFQSMMLYGLIEWYYNNALSVKENGKTNSLMDSSKAQFILRVLLIWVKYIKMSVWIFTLVPSNLLHQLNEWDLDLKVICSNGCPMNAKTTTFQRCHIISHGAP